MQPPMHPIFFNDFGRLRSGWGLGIFLLVLIVGFIVLEPIVRTLYGFISSYWSIPHPELVLGLSSKGGSLVVALGVGYLCAHFLEELPWRSLGASFTRGWFKDLVIGSALGFATLAVAVVIEIGGPGLRLCVKYVDWATV